MQSSGAIDLTLLPDEVDCPRAEASQGPTLLVGLAPVKRDSPVSLPKPPSRGKPPKPSGDKGVFEQLSDESRLLVGLPVYRKVKLLGSGAFGKAYLVEATRGFKGQPVPMSPTAKPRRVLKKIPLKGISEDQREAAFREALLMRKISRGCPFITQFSEVFLGKSGTILCLVMEFCAGGDLRNALRQRDGEKVAEEQVLSWAAQVGLALHHCHTHGVLHRDVKPENCFLRAHGGDLLLGDFGISCALDERSMAKTFIGSPLYLSPEIVNQERYSWKTDVWSLGVMLYEMLMLEPPFKGMNICQLALKIMSNTPEPVDAMYSKPTRQLVDLLLDKNSSTRPSMDEVLLVAPLASAAEAVSVRHRVAWPPPTMPSTFAKQSSLVKRLRDHTCRSATLGDGSPAAEEYEDDFEAADDDDDAEAEDTDFEASPVAEYDDDFEAASGGSEASYAEDFEEASDPGEESANLDAEIAELSEERVRQQLVEELGTEGMAIADSLGVFSFLEGMRASAQKPHG